MFLAPKIYSTFKESVPYSVKMDSNKEVISNLKFIGKLKKGDKINTKFMYVQPDGITTRISRTFINYDNRNNALHFVDKTVNDAIKLIELYSDSNKMLEKKMCRHLVDDLKASKVGLVNLKETYSEDLKFKCDMETILQSIDSKLSEMFEEHEEEEEEEEETSLP